MNQTKNGVGFSKDAIVFLRDLQTNNNKTWFAENKTRYKAVIEQPARYFMSQMSEAIEEIFEHPVKGKIFRIYRDLRFSKDKTPYNTHVRMLFHNTEEGNKNCGAQPALYLSLDSERLNLGLGNHEFDKNTLGKYRETIENPTHACAISSIVSDLKKQGFRMDAPELKRVPNGFDKNHPHGDFLRRKGLSIWHDGTTEVICGDRAINTCLSYYQKMKPLYDWLAQI